MLKRWIASFVAMVVSGGSLLAQGPVELEPPIIQVQGVAAGAAQPVIVESFEARGGGDRFWFGAEYLLWRVKDAPVPIPLITANSNPGTIASLNEPGTTILFGAGSGQDTGFGWFSGMRFTLGGWRDDDQIIGWEANGFVLERRSNIFNASTAGGAARVLGVPLNATEPFALVFPNPAGETTLNTGGFPGVTSVHLNSRLWGAEANGIVNLSTTDRLQVVGIVGFRYLDLVENLTSISTIADDVTRGVLTVTDGFGTRNQFYGGQIGLRAALNRGRWNIDTTAKIAFGSTHQVQHIVGTTEVTQGAFGFPTGVTQAANFAEPSNIGTIIRNVFAVVPEVQVTLAYQWGESIRPFIGYNFMYLSNAIRPGDQIDRNVNLTQNPFANAGPLVGAPAPLPTFRSGDFWAQGINFGVELKY